MHCERKNDGFHEQTTSLYPTNYSRHPLLRILSGEDLVSVIARVRNSGVQEERKITTYEIICYYANIKFLTWPHKPEKYPAASRKFSRSHVIEERLSLLYRNVALYYVSQDFGRNTQVSAIARNKSSEVWRWGGMEVSPFP